MQELTIDVHGLDCPSEVKIIREALRPLLDEDQLRFDLINAHVMIAVPSEESSPAAYVDAINRAGLKAEVCTGHGTAAAAEISRADRVSGFVFALSGVLILLAFVLQLLLEGFSTGTAVRFLTTAEHPRAVTMLLIAGAVLGMAIALPKAWSSLKNLRADMHLLMCIAVCGALILGEYTEAAMVAFLFAVSLRLEHWSVAHARTSIQALLELAPAEALLVTPDASRRVPVAEVNVGAVIRVLPGDRVPLDGEIAAGATALDESPVTGESMPVEKGPGTAVFAGTINQNASIDVRVTRPANDSTVARIIRLVQEAQGRKAEVERWADQFARYYTPAMLALAFAVAVVPPLAMGMAWADSIYRALVLLLIACPCALVISTPVTIVAGLTAAARNGVLIKGGVYLELAARIKAIALDKTGTLTLGAPRVARVVPLTGHATQEILSHAAAIEAHSTHPLARAIVQYAEEQGVDAPGVSGAAVRPGKGAAARIGDKHYWLGNARMLADHGHPAQAAAALFDGDETPENSWVILGCEDHVCGGIQLHDQLRSESAAAVQALQSRQGIHITLLTGDGRHAAKIVADATGLTDVRAELLPEDKATAIEEMLADYGVVAMVGDGINDAPALARASLGIAMGAAGTDTALETADVALMKDDLRKLPWLIGHARRTLTIIRENIAIALGLKLAVLALAAAGHTTLWLAVVADMGASLLVIMNGLRLLRRAHS